MTMQYCRNTGCTTSVVVNGFTKASVKDLELQQRLTVVSFHHNQRQNETESQRKGQTFSASNSSLVQKNYVLLEKQQHLFINLLKRNLSTSNTCLTVKVDPKKNYYLILGVTPHCTDTKIKQAYYRLSKVYHPDVNKTKTAVAKFHEITEAYEVLSNPDLRRVYDSGRHGQLHGVHRGVTRHPVNLNARGPHQIRKTDRQVYDEWLKEHYRATFKQRKVDIWKHEITHQEARFVNVDNRTEIYKGQKDYKKNYQPGSKSIDKFDSWMNVILMLTAGLGGVAIWLKLAK